MRFSHAFAYRISGLCVVLKNANCPFYLTMRRGPGIVALDRNTLSNDHYSSLSQRFNEAKLQQLRNQIEHFSHSLRTFAVAHKQDIRKDPEFRHAFQRMCASLWVDPLAGHPTTSDSGGSLSKVVNLWSDLTGMSDWQYELGVQIVDYCISTRPQNGGIISIQDLIHGIIRVRQGRSHSTVHGDSLVTPEDVERSIRALKPLGCGYSIFNLNGIKMIRTVPQELSDDALFVLGYLSSAQTARKDALGIPFIIPNHLVEYAKVYSPGTSWTLHRTIKVLEDMVMNDGTLWIDPDPNCLTEHSPASEHCKFYALSIAESTRV